MNIFIFDTAMNFECPFGLCLSDLLNLARYFFSKHTLFLIFRLGDRKDGDMVGLLSICNNLRFIPPFSGASQRYRERDLIVRGEPYFSKMFLVNRLLCLTYNKHHNCFAIKLSIKTIHWLVTTAKQLQMNFTLLPQTMHETGLRNTKKIFVPTI